MFLCAERKCILVCSCLVSKLPAFLRCTWNTEIFVDHQDHCCFVLGREGEKLLSCHTSNTYFLKGQRVKNCAPKRKFFGNFADAFFRIWDCLNSSEQWRSCKESVVCWSGKLIFSSLSTHQISCGKSNSHETGQYSSNERKNALVFFKRHNLHAVLWVHTLLSSLHLSLSWELSFSGMLQLQGVWWIQGKNSDMSACGWSLQHPIAPFIGRGQISPKCTQGDDTASWPKVQNTVSRGVVDLCGRGGRIAVRYKTAIESKQQKTSAKSFLLMQTPNNTWIYWFCDNCKLKLEQAGEKLLPWFIVDTGICLEVLWNFSEPRAALETAHVISFHCIVAISSKHVKLHVIGENVSSQCEEYQSVKVCYFFLLQAQVVISPDCFFVFWQVGLFWMYSDCYVWKSVTSFILAETLRRKSFHAMFVNSVALGKRIKEVLNTFSVTSDSQILSVTGDLLFRTWVFFRYEICFSPLTQWSAEKWTCFCSIWHSKFLGGGIHVFVIGLFLRKWKQWVLGAPLLRTKLYSACRTGFTPERRNEADLYLTQTDSALSFVKDRLPPHNLCLCFEGRSGCAECLSETNLQ